MEGGCDCKQVRYKLTAQPMITHCCHCTWCQRESGAAFGLNAVIERAHVQLLGAEPVRVETPSASGKGQQIYRCRTCHVAVWSHYAGGGENIAFIRVGTLDDPNAYPPDVHIFTSTKQKWVQFPAGAKVFAEFYNPAEVWSDDNRARYRIAKSAAR